MYICLYPLPIPWRPSFIFLTRFLSYTPLIEAERKPFETQYEHTLNIWTYFEYTLNTQYMNMIWIPVSTILSLLPTSVEWCVLLYAVCNRRVRLTKPFCTHNWMGDWYLRPSTNIASETCFFSQQICVPNSSWNVNRSFKLDMIKVMYRVKMQKVFISVWAEHLIWYIHLRDYRKRWPADCCVISQEMFASFPGNFPISLKIFKIFGPKLTVSLSTANIIICRQISQRD